MINNERKGNPKGQTSEALINLSEFYIQYFRSNDPDDLSDVVIQAPKGKYSLNDVAK